MVQFNSIGIANTQQQQWHFLLESAGPQPWHKSAGGTLGAARSSSWFCLSQEAKIREDLRPTSVAQPALYASQAPPPSLSVGSCLHPPNITSPPRVLPQHVHSIEATEVARNCSTPPEVFWCVSLYGVLTNAAQLHKAEQYMCVINKVSFFTCPFMCLL